MNRRPLLLQLFILRANWRDLALFDPDELTGHVDNAMGHNRALT